MRYRTIDVRIWGDERFRALSPPQPNGQTLFLYLLTNPNTNSIPGLFRAGAAAMAEELGWDHKAFGEAFEEVLNQGLVKADLRARVIFIPNAIRYNKPQSPNVVKSWALHWDEIPECELKSIAYQTLKALLKGLGEAYVKAFEEAIGKASRKTMPNQEQEQEKDISSLREEVVSQADAVPLQSNFSKPNCPHEEIIALYHETLPMCPQVRIWNKTRQSYLRSRWNEHPKHKSLEFWKNFFEHVKQSQFLTGQVPGRDGKSPFAPDLEWLLKPNNFARVIEGRYHRGDNE